ncbi:MAG: hypothetical protein IKR86_11415 [Candidatus Methanomethylophilaceae archaeon]|nr:hypothetical protein [Candidatus Methanomethylophilaceae archaeon]
MNRTNKAIVGAVYGVAIAYGAAAFVLTVLSFEGDAGTVIPGIAKIHGPYTGFVAPLAVNFAVALVGIALSIGGMLTTEPLDVVGRTNPVQYLWTHRPNAFLRCIGAPWGLITSAWRRSKPLAIVPIVLIPFYAVWSAIISVALIVPFLVARAIVSAKISSAAKKERIEYRSSTEFGICPECKMDFARPQAICKCGLVIDYPVPGIYGISTQTCNNGDEIGCTPGSRVALRTRCPYCKKQIETQEAHPICMALAGAKGSGKTTLMLAGVDEIIDRARKAGIPSQTATKDISAEARGSKDNVCSTEPGELESQCVFLKPMNDHETEIVINDVSGFEFKPSRDKSLFEEYYRYADGILFVVDPMRAGRGDESHMLEAFNSFYGVYSLIKGARTGTVFETRLAVVATRRDATGLDDDGVREYLVGKGEGNFVRTVEAVFRNVRYFSACCVGSDTGTAGRPFVWIMESADKGLAETLGPDVVANR